MTLVNFMFQCQNCEHSTEIYFENQFYPNEVFVEGNCSSCKQYRLLNNGDMGYRSDYPDPMYPPWQIQCINLKDERRYCKECSVHQVITLADAEVLCYVCRGQMKFAGTVHEPAPDSLIQLINKLST